MIVKDLIKRLKKMPQTKEVYFLAMIMKDYIFSTKINRRGCE